MTGAVMSVHGRLGGAPREISTTSGKPIAVASVALTLPTRSDEESTFWLGVAAFGRQAEELLRAQKGETISAMGRCQLSSWTGRDGTEREQPQIVADAIVHARSARPSGRKRRGDRPPSAPANGGSGDGDSRPF